MHCFQEQEKELQLKSVGSIEMSQEVDDDITKALDKLRSKSRQDTIPLIRVNDSVSMPKPVASQEITAPTLNVNVASNFYELGPKSPPRKLQLIQTITRVYIPASEVEETAKHEAFYQVTEYAKNSGPW